MGKLIIAALAFFILAGALFASDSVSYANSNELALSRTLDVNKTGRISITTSTVQYSYTSTIVLNITNMGAFEKDAVIITEAVPALPEGAKISYDPKPEALGKNNAWGIGTLAPGESRQIVATVDGELSREWLVALPAPQVTVEQIKAKLVATKIVSEGDGVDVFLTTENGKPIPKAKITAITPSGKKIDMLTDSNGQAEYKAAEAGTYLYLVNDYTVLEVPETESKALMKSPPYTASVQTTPAETAALSQFTMIIAGFMLVSLILLGVIAYYSMKGEEEPPKPRRDEEKEEGERWAPEPKAPKQAPVAPVDESTRVEKAREMTKRILEARKKELAAKGAKKKK